MFRSIKTLALILLFASTAYGQALPIRNDTPSNLRDLGSNLQVGRNFSVDQKGQVLAGAVSPGTGATNLGKARGGTAASGDVGIQCLGIRNDAAAALNSNSQYQPFVSNISGGMDVDIDFNFQASTTRGLQKLEDAPHVSGDSGVPAWAIRTDTLASSSGTTGDYSAFNTDSVGGLWVNDTYRGTPSATQPSVTNTTSFTCLAANASRRSFSIQNNTAANIMISITGATLTGIVPTSSNIGIVLSAGSSYNSPPNAVSTALITCFQSSGGTVNTISVWEQ